MFCVTVTQYNNSWAFQVLAVDIKCSWNPSVSCVTLTKLKESHVLRSSRNMCQISFVQAKSKRYLWGWLPLGRELRAFVKLEEHVCFFSVSVVIYASWEAFKRQELPTAIRFFFSLFALTWLSIMSSKDSVLKISHCDASEAFACDLACTGDAELYEVHHCPVWLPVCSVRRSELWTASQDESQPCPQCVHCRPLLLLICFRQHQGLQDYFFFSLFYSSVPCWIEHYV